jgi:hypothetical protein
MVAVAVEPPWTVAGLIDKLLIATRWIVIVRLIEEDPTVSVILQGVSADTGDV